MTSGAAGRCLAWAVVAAVLVFAPPSRASGGQAASISTINAVFDQNESATHFTVDYTGFSGPVTVTWTLTLECVDQGCPPPPGAHGTLDDPLPQVDPGCDNAGVGTTAPVVERPAAGQTPEFVWHHPPGSADPTHTYNCDSTKEGLKGHQGLIRVSVTDGQTVCTASYKGTDSSSATSVQDGTADIPTCRSAIPLPAGLVTGLRTMDLRLTSVIHSYEKGRLTGRAFATAVDKVVGYQDAHVTTFFPAIFGVPFNGVYADLDAVDGDLQRAALGDALTRPAAGGLYTRSSVRTVLDRAATAQRDLVDLLTRATGVPGGLVAGLAAIEPGIASLTDSYSRGSLTGESFATAIDAVETDRDAVLTNFFPAVFSLPFDAVYADLDSVDRALDHAVFGEPLTRRSTHGAYTRATVGRQLVLARAAERTLGVRLRGAAAPAA